MKNKVKSFLYAAVLIVFVAIILSCPSMPSIVSEPLVSFDSVSLTGISFSGIDMKARIKIQNNNALSIPFPEINWKLSVTDTDFLDGVIKKGTKIAANASTVVELPFTVGYEGLYQVVSGLLSSDEAPYRIDLAARFPLPVLENKTFSTSFNGSIPMLKAPSISFSGIKFNSITLSKVEFVLNWQVDNKNAFAVNLDKLDYNFAVNNTSWTNGGTSRVTLPARKTTQVPITVNINSLTMIQDIVALAVGGKPANYICSGEAALSPLVSDKFPGLENIAALKLPFTYSGTTNLR
jgi:LEA14-like dessication related protein